ncbi:hypothetical protein [Flavobacterium sp.]|uniref:hypothetical protein n=1 Tax=Flavobacterium sp. TaxID=239 RepID=UPI0031D3436B
MKIQNIFNEKIRNLFTDENSSTAIEGFEYKENNYGDKELYIFNKNETFLEWDMNLIPDDPGYSKEHNPPILHSKFPMIDVYDELTFSHLLYTINSVTVNVVPNYFTRINVFMKQYCFFQFSQISNYNTFDSAEHSSLRDLFWFYFLYTHPVNETTLYSCHFDLGKLVYTDKNIFVRDYFNSYYDFFIDNYNEYENKLDVSPTEILACKELTNELLTVFEGNAIKLNYPGESKAVFYVNNISSFLRDYQENKHAIFNLFTDLAKGINNKYDDFLFSVILQNYVCYILRKNFSEIEYLSDFLFSKEDDAISSLIINKIFSDTIFCKRFAATQNINIKNFKYVVCHFDEESKRINL